MFIPTTTSIECISSQKAFNWSRRLALALGTAVIISNLFATTAFGVAITVLNPSFEIDNPGPGGVSSGPTTNWSGVGHLDRTTGLFNTVIEPTPDGADAERLGWSNGGTPSQLLSALLAANTTYTLTVDVGDRTDLPFAGATLNLGTGPVVGSNLLPPVVIANTTPNNTAAAGDGWQTWQSTFTTGAAPVNLGQPLRIDLANVSGIQTLFDNVRLDAAIVPEPSTSILCATVFAAFLCKRRGTRRK